MNSRSVAQGGGPTTGALVDKWMERSRAELIEAVDSLTRYYATNATAVQAAGLEAAAIDAFVPGTVFEAVFFNWLRVERPEVLKRLVALMPAILFAKGRESGGAKRARDLVTGLAKLRDDARRFAEQVAAFRDVPGVELGSLEAPLREVARHLDAVITPITAEMNATGRPQDPIRPLDVRVLHEAGLTHGDIGGLLDIKAEAVRKQLRKTRRT